MNKHKLIVALAQLAPVWLNKQATIHKIEKAINEAANQRAELIVFGEALLPGYPYWLSLTNGAAFNNQMQKEMHAHYVRNAIQIEKGDLNSISALALKHKMAIYLGTIEHAVDRGHSLYCSLVFINNEGEIKSVHRKLRPTYEERLTWSPGDGNGLQVHALKDFRLGGLNCWENWMPLSRAALYGMGENVHIAVWPGAYRNTHDITPFIAKESRSFSIAVSGLMRKSDFPQHTPHLEAILANCPEILSNGGSCVAAPNGEWIIEPIVNEEGVFLAEIDLNRVYEERQNFDAAGHYSRPDVTKLIVNRNRQSIVEI